MEPALCQYQRRLHARRAGTHHGHCAPGAVFYQLVVVVSQLAAKGGVDGTFHRAALVCHQEAVHAADAFANQHIVAAFCLVGPFGVGKLATRHAHIIRNALLQQLLGKGGVLDGVNRNHRDFDIGLDVFGEVLFPALGKAGRLDDGRAGFIGAAADIQAGNAQTFKVARNADALLLIQPVLNKFAAVDAHRHREIGAAGKTDAKNNLGDKAHAVEKVAAVFVGALVGVRAEELVHKVAVRRVNLHTVKAGNFGNHRALDKLFGHGFHLFGGQCARHFANHLAHHRRRGDNLLAVQQAAHGLVARVVQLQKYFGIVGVHCLGKAHKAWNVLRVGGAQLVAGADTGLLVNAANLGDDQPAAAFRAVGIKANDLVGRLPRGRREPGAHCGHDDPVFQLDLADLAFFKKLWILHETSPSFR